MIQNTTRLTNMTDVPDPWTDTQLKQLFNPFCYEYEVITHKYLQARYGKKIILMYRYKCGIYTLNIYQPIRSIDIAVLYISPRSYC